LWNSSFAWEGVPKKTEKKEDYLGIATGRAENLDYEVAPGSHSESLMGNAVEKKWPDPQRGSWLWSKQGRGPKRPPHKLGKNNPNKRGKRGVKVPESISPKLNSLFES